MPNHRRHPQHKPVFANRPQKRRRQQEYVPRTAMRAYGIPSHMPYGYHRKGSQFVSHQPTLESVSQNNPEPSKPESVHQQRVLITIPS